MSMPQNIKNVLNALFKTQQEKDLFVCWISSVLKNPGKRVDCDFKIIVKETSQEARRDLLMKLVTTTFDEANKVGSKCFYGVISCMEHFANFEESQPSVLVIDDTSNWSNATELKEKLAKFPQTNVFLLSGK